MWNSCFLTLSTFRAIKPLVADPPHINIKFKGNKCFSLLTLVPDHELSPRATVRNHTCPNPREGTPWPHSSATAEEGEEIVPVLRASLFRLSNLSRARGHRPAAGLARLPPRYHRVPPGLWAKLEMMEVAVLAMGCASLQEGPDTREYLSLALEVQKQATFMWWELGTLLWHESETHFSGGILGASS